MCTNSLSRIISFTSRNILSNRNIRLNPCYNTGLSESILLRYAEQAAGRSEVEAQQTEVSAVCKFRHEKPVVSASTKAISSKLHPTQVSQDRMLKNGTKKSAEVKFRSVAPDGVKSEIGFSKSKLTTLGKTESKIVLKSSINENSVQDGRPDPFLVPKVSDLSPLMMRYGVSDVPQHVFINVDRCVKYYETQVGLNNDRSIYRSIVIDLNDFAEIDTFARDIHRKIDGNEIIDGYFMSSDSLSYPTDTRSGYHLRVIQSGNDPFLNNVIATMIDLRTFDSHTLGELIIDRARLKIIKLDGFEEHHMVQIVAVPNDEFIERLKERIFRLPGLITHEKSYYIELFRSRMIENYF